MAPVWTLLGYPVYIRPPTILLEWAGWFLLLGLAILALMRWRGYEKRTIKRQFFLTIFVLSIPVTNLFLGFRWPDSTEIMVAGAPFQANQSIVMIFSALPWMLAGGLLGPISAAGVAALTGLLLGLWGTHDVFTIPAIVLFAILFSLAIQQSYRTSFFWAIRQPAIITIILLPLLIVLLNAGMIFNVLNLITAPSIDTFVNHSPAALAIAVEALIAAVFVQLIAIGCPTQWGQKQPLQPSPFEKNVEARLLFFGWIFITLLLVSLFVGIGFHSTRNALCSTALILLASIAFLLLHRTINHLKTSLRELSQQMARFTQENYDHPLPAIGVDEINHLQEEMEKMRLALGARSREFNRLQLISQGIASIPDPVLVTDHEIRLMLINPAAQHILGIENTIAQSQPIELIIHQKELSELLLVDEIEKKSTEVTLPSGKVYFATVSSVLAEGRLVGRVCVMRDVTHFKELDTLKSDFVATVSHDLNSPLTLIKSYASMLESAGKLNEQQKNYTKKILASVENMEHLVGNLLDLGWIEADLDLHVNKVAVIDVVNAVVDNLHAQADQKDIRLGMEVDRNLPQLITVDQDLLRQALHNLVENGIKYTPKGGRVTVRVRVNPNGVLFEVQDTGIGISQADQPRLFEKFFRGSNLQARQQRGSGLGLAIVRSIAERHGGSVWAESQLDQGSTFSMLIPSIQSKRKKKANNRSNN